MNNKRLNNKEVTNSVNKPNIKSSIDEALYENFVNKILKSDLHNLSIDELRGMYDTSQSIINEYYIVSETLKPNQELIMKLQYATMTILYNLNFKMNKELTKKISQQESVSNLIKKQGKNLSRENKVIKKELKTIIVTIIAIVLAISIIPTAIVGIENMPSKFILPFIATVILFGMIMIIFTFSIYNIKFSMQTWSILMAMTILFLISWLMCWNIDVNFTPRNIEDTQINIYR